MSAHNSHARASLPVEVDFGRHGRWPPRLSLASRSLPGRVYRAAGDCSYGGIDGSRNERVEWKPFHPKRRLRCRTRGTATGTPTQSPSPTGSPTLAPSVTPPAAPTASQTVSASGQPLATVPGPQATVVEVAPPAPAPPTSTPTAIPTVEFTPTPSPVPVDVPLTDGSTVRQLAGGAVLPSGITFRQCVDRLFGSDAAWSWGVGVVYLGNGLWRADYSISGAPDHVSVFYNERTGTTSPGDIPDGDC